MKALGLDDVISGGDRRLQCMISAGRLETAVPAVLPCKRIHR
jgi:hypothetical protein